MLPRWRLGLGRRLGCLGVVVGSRGEGVPRDSTCLITTITGGTARRSTRKERGRVCTASRLRLVRRRVPHSPRGVADAADDELESSRWKCPAGHQRTLATSRAFRRRSISPARLSKATRGPWAPNEAASMPPSRGHSILFHCVPHPSHARKDRTAEHILGQNMQKAAVPMTSNSNSPDSR